MSPLQFHAAELSRSLNSKALILSIDRYSEKMLWMMFEDTKGVMFMGTPNLQIEQGVYQAFTIHTAIHRKKYKRGQFAYLTFAPI